ncbi:hypothetical protein DCCM_2838 [Desulfocucumis palustris]|uniref:Uncharacterized protein n=1 Tax=Desulfocucumis palustris TaxID=1898651 RepID=A0A2L2XBX4_9FIRM|nr:hypothetical protein DCCM_2838 [Desulfocucumis palustris]
MKMNPVDLENQGGLRIKPPDLFCAASIFSGYIFHKLDC